MKPQKKQTNKKTNLQAINDPYKEMVIFLKLTFEYKINKSINYQTRFKYFC